MTTIREFYQLDFGVLSIHSAFKLREPATGAEIEVLGRLHYDFDANAKFISYLVPMGLDPFQAAMAVLDDSVEILKRFEGTEVSTSLPGELPTSSKELGFAGRIFLYMEDVIAEADQSKITAVGAERGLSVRYRGPQYAEARTALERPLAFISHEWSDREVIARPLADALLKLGCPVWYSEYSLKVGDSLRESIESGLKTCAKCVLLLTPRYLQSKGWTKTEFNGVFTREMLESKDPTAKKRILPVWHEVTPEQVYEYSPTLVDRLGLNWSEGVDEVARKLAREIKG